MNKILMLSCLLSFFSIAAEQCGICFNKIKSWDPVEQMRVFGKVHRWCASEYHKQNNKRKIEKEQEDAAARVRDGHEKDCDCWVCDARTTFPNKELINLMPMVQEDSEFVKKYAKERLLVLARTRAKL